MEERISVMASGSEHTGKQKKLPLVVAIILLLIVGSSSIFFVSADNSQGSQRKIPVTPTGTTITKTPTLRATPTVQPSPQLTFYDEFLQNNQNWPTSNEQGYTRTVDNGTLTLIATGHKSLVESLPVNTTFSDFSLTMTFTLVAADKNDSVGLYLRGDSNLDHDYRVDIYGDSSYSISKESITENNQQATTVLVDHTRTPWLHLNGQSNTLTITMKGSNLVLTLNGAIVKSITDTDYSRGQIALFVNNGDTSDEVYATMSSIIVYSLPGQTP
jgi:hypothetical protein